MECLFIISLFHINKGHSMSDSDYIKAIQETKEVWKWLFENPDKNKEDWFILHPEYVTYSYQQFETCAICRYRRSKFGAHECNGSTVHAKCHLNIICTTYNKEWRHCKDLKVRSQYAEKIYLATVEECIKYKDKG